VSPKGQVESVDRDWFRKVWSVDRFCELLVDSGFHLAEVKHLDSGIILAKNLNQDTLAIWKKCGL
ncbi:MAG: hypothetical protein VCA12_11300, partial [Pseudomonadales bacterium]